MDKVDADLITVNEDGHEEWYKRIHFGGMDEGGVYQIILEGPAEGEKVYVG